MVAGLPTWARFLLIAVIVFVCGVVASRPADLASPGRPTGPSAQAAKAIDDLVHPTRDRDPLRDLPSDFVTVLDEQPYTIRASDGTLRTLNPDGACSGPDGATEWDFDAGCKSHDLGYDLLRYAEFKGQPLPQDARRQLDDQLSRDMHARCVVNPRGSADQCHAVASLYTAGLTLNSWRQRWGPPDHEPVLSWVFGIAVVALLLVARVPRRRGPTPAPSRRELNVHAPDRYGTFLRVASLGVAVLSQALLTVVYWAGVSAHWLWLVTWVIQVVPVFFFAGGQANLLSWQTVRDEHAGFGHYLASRIPWLLRPLMAFVLAWLVLPVLLDLVDAPKLRVEVFGRLIAHPLWFLAVYLVAVAATPLMAWLHRRWRVLTPVALLAAVAVVDLCRMRLHWGAAGYLTVPLAALFMQQLGFGFADGSLLRVPRRALAAVAALCVPVLLALTTWAGYPRNMIGAPADPASNINPPTLALLVLGVAQVCLVLLLRRPVTRWLAGSRQWRLVCFARSAPITLYLGFVTVLAVVVGVVGVLDTPAVGTVTHAIDWLTRPRWLAVLAVLLVPLLAVFHRFERAPGSGFTGGVETHRSRLAATLGVLWGALGLLGFVVTGFGGSTANLLVLPVDPLQNLVHLLLGGYLVHVARSGACHRRWPWLLTALACVPPMLTPGVNGLSLVLHGGTLALALLAALPRALPAERTIPGWNRRLPPMLRLPEPPLATRMSTSALRSARAATRPAPPAR
jgi:hypothetical protein